MRALLLGALLACAAGCGPAHERAPRTPSSAAAEDIGPVEASLKGNEIDVLSVLGRGDPRIGARVPLLVLPGEDEPAREGGLYSAEVRAKTQGEAEALYAGWRDQAVLGKFHAKGAAKLQLERELLGRLLVAERYRVEEEKDLPRAGSEIVRGIILVGGDPSKAAWVTRRLEEIRLLLRPKSLTVLESAELDDSLDPLERGAPTTALAAIASLRVALAQVVPLTTRAAEPDRLERGLHAHLGVSGPLSARREALLRTLALLKAEVTARGKGVSGDDVRLAESHAEEILGNDAVRCVEGDTPSLLRGALPPPERWGACHVLLALVSARSNVEALATLIALHDGVATALWALAARADGMDPDRANERWRLLAAIPPERQSRILRAVIARPVSAIAAGLAIEMVTRRGWENAAQTAGTWRRFGDAPFDVIEREVLAR